MASPAAPRRKPRAVIYARLASSRASDRHRLPAQLISCRLMAERLGGAVVENGFKDVSESALLADRPGIRLLLRHLVHHPAPYVIDTNLSRPGCSRADQVKLVLQLHQHGAATALAKPNALIEVISEKEQLNAGR